MERFSLNNVSKFEFQKQINDQFSLFKCWVAGVGKNRNFSYISKENMNKALPTLSYSPVVGHLIQGEDGKYRLGSHDVTIDPDTWELVPLTMPVGVVMDNSFGYETVEEYGTEVEYLTANLVLWTGRYPELFDCKYSDEIFCAQSMEIDVSQFRPYEEDSNYTEILDFKFSALCLLGKSDDKELNNEPCFISSRLEPINFNADEFAIKLNELKEEIHKCFAKEGETMEDNKELTTTETEFEAEAEVETVEETATEEVAETTAETETEETVEAEAETETVDYEAMYNEAQNTIATLTAKVTELTETVDSLMPYKLASEKAERDKAESDIFAKYDSHIGSMDEYVALKSKASEYSIEELDRECLLLVGKYAMSAPAAETETEETESTIQFALDNENENKPKSKYSEAYEAYKSR